MTARTCGMTLKLSWRYLVAFAALTVLCGTSHEFVHHFTGAALCGAFGTKTFNSFSLAPGCETDIAKAYWAAMAGPILTFALMWIGYAMLRRDDPAAKRMGFALVFANFPVNRMIFVLLNQNDEQYASKMMFGESRLVFWLTVVAVLTISLPPVIEGLRQLQNRPRVVWLAAFFLLPFVFVVLFAGLFLENFLMTQHHFLATRIIGIPWLILLVEVVSAIIFELFKNALMNRPDPLQRDR